MPSRRSGSRSWRAWPEREAYAHPGYVSLLRGRHDARALRRVALDEGRCCTRSSCATARRSRSASTRRHRSRRTATAARSLGRRPEAVAARSGRRSTRWAAEQRRRLGARPLRLVRRSSCCRIPASASSGSSTSCTSSSRARTSSGWTVEHKVRKNVKKARRADVRIEFDATGARLDDFLRSTSARSSAATRPSATGSRASSSSASAPSAAPSTCTRCTATTSCRRSSCCSPSTARTRSSAAPTARVRRCGRTTC